jgi:hypothetical protein
MADLFVQTVSDISRAANNRDAERTTSLLDSILATESPKHVAHMYARLGTTSVPFFDPIRLFAERTRTIAEFDTWEDMSHDKLLLPAERTQIPAIAYILHAHPTKNTLAASSVEVSNARNYMAAALRAGLSDEQEGIIAVAFQQYKDARYAHAVRHCAAMS